MSQDEPKKFQIQNRMKKLIVPCDKLSNHMWNYSAEEYADIIKHRDRCECVEGTDKKGKVVVTPYWLGLVDDCVDLSPLNAFHREVLFHAISAYEQGFRIITISMTLDSLSGGAEKRHVCKEQYEVIKDAFKKLATTSITINLAPLINAYPNYKKRLTGAAELTSPILPCKILDAEINGQKTLTVKILDESPLMTVAKLKKQVLTYDATPLAIPNQKNTPQIITVKNYLLRRIKLMKSSRKEKGLNNSILFKTIYENCGLADADKWQKQDTRKIIVDTLTGFKNDGVIKNFEIEKSGGSYRSIKITP